MHPYLKGLGHDVHTVYDEGLVGHPDTEIWQAAQRESRFLVTQDLDFSNTQSFAPGSHNGILLVRLRMPNRKNLIERVGEIFQAENANEWRSCFVVATERKIRVLRPQRKENSE